MELKVEQPFNDDDPWPRAAAVSPSSAFASVSIAALVDSAEVVVGPAATSTRRVTPVNTWLFQEDDPVALPDVWSRRDPALCDFRGPATYVRRVQAQGPYARLVFDGIDYLGAVSVDGERVALHEGGFTPVAVDLPVQREVEVSVEVDDPVEREMTTPDPLLKVKRKVKGVFEEHDSRPGGMAIGDHYDAKLWGVRWGTGGMAGAWLHEHGPVRIDAAFVSAVPGSLRVNWVLTHLGETAADVEVHGTIGETGFVVRARLEPGASRLAVRLGLSGEETWTPERPTLYTLHSTVLVNNEPSDALDTTFGVRSVEMAVEGPTQYHLRLNGERVYVRAANYIPGVFRSELPLGTIETDMELARAAGLNSLGVHAGVNPLIAEAADRAGVLLYQDFPLQWSYDPDGGPLVEGGPTFREASTWLAAELVYLFYNHPSVVYWCGHNEPAFQLREAFGTVNVPELLGLVETMDACPSEEALDFERLEVLRAVDPSRPATAVSGLGASRPDGDNHDYTGSLSGGSATNANASPFVSEYGAWFANFSAAADVAAARGDWPTPPEAEDEWYDQTHLFSTQVTYAGRPSRFTDFSTWCFAGQLWGGWHAKVVTEKARLAKWSPSGGQRYHFFVDHWGAGGAGVVDRHRTTGPAYGGLAMANRPIAALAPFPTSARVAPGSSVRLPIYVVNDLTRGLGEVEVAWRLALLDGEDDCWLVGRDTPERPGPLQGELAPSDQCCVIPRRTGRVLHEGAATVEVGPDALVQANELEWTADVEGPVALFMTVNGQTGWTSFMVAPDGWSPAPGITGRTRFRVELQRPGVLRRRWTGDAVSDLDAVPPDQYLLGDLPVNVFDDVVVRADGTLSTPSLPWSVRA